MTKPTTTPGPRFRPQAEQLDDRCVPAINLTLPLPIPGVPAVPDGTFAVASADGMSRVQLYAPDGSIRLDFQAYGAGFTGGVYVAVGDVTGDRVADVVTSTGPGGTANVRVFDGEDGKLVASFFAYPEAFTGGANVGVGDVNGDGYADVVCGVGVGGGPNIRVFSGRQLIQGATGLVPVSAGGALINSFYAYPEAFTGGVRVAVGNFDNDLLFADILTGVGSGGGPNVRILSGARVAQGSTSLGSVSAGGTLINSFYALPEGFTGGVYVTAGDVTNDGRDEVIVGVGSGGGANVRALDANNGTLLRSFYAFDAELTGGVRVAATDIDGDGYDDFVVGTGPGIENRIRTFSGFNTDTTVRPDFVPFGDYDGGLNVG